MKIGKKQKRQLMLVSGSLFYLSALFTPATISLILFLIAYFILGKKIIQKVLGNLNLSTIFDENFLMLVATLGAMALNQMEEAVAVLLFYQIGEYFQDLAVDKSRRSIKDLMNLMPDTARLYNDNIEKVVHPDKIKINDLILVKPGEKIPLDGLVIQGISDVDTSMLTGESIPQPVQEGLSVLSGSINLSSVLIIQVSQISANSTVSKILELIEDASQNKSKSEHFITKFAQVYTPIVVGLALLLALIPPVVLQESYSIWIYRALVFLVVSCPCALVISIPLSFFAGIGSASRQGILIKGSNYLETLSHVDQVVFDKTGTLTQGQFTLMNIDSFNLEAPYILELAAYAEAHLNHPIAQSILKSYAKSINHTRIQAIKDFPGKGVEAIIDQNLIHIGNSKLFIQNNITIVKEIHQSSELMLALNGIHVANIYLSDTIKNDSYGAIQKLKDMSISNIYLLSGDKKDIAERIGHQLGINHVIAQCLPHEKVEAIMKLLKDQTGKSKTAFVGDGINDAPSLAISDVGIAMGALGSDAAIEAADVVILNDEPSKVADAIKHAKQVMRIVKQNIIFALGIKIGTLILASFGLASMWLAIFADVGVALLAVLNASRILQNKQKRV